MFSLNSEKDLLLYSSIDDNQAAQIARTWKVESTGAGYIVYLNINNDFLERHGINIESFRIKVSCIVKIPPHLLPELNDNIIGEIKVIKEFQTIESTTWQFAATNHGEKDFELMGVRVWDCKWNEVVHRSYSKILFISRIVVLIFMK